LESGFDDVGRILRAQGFAEDIFDANGFQDGAHGFTGDNASPRGGGSEEDFGPAVAGVDFVWDGVFAQGDIDHLIAG
jgi:hypothetical protein